MANTGGNMTDWDHLVSSTNLRITQFSCMVRNPKARNVQTGGLQRSQHLPSSGHTIGNKTQEINYNRNGRFFTIKKDFCLR